MTLRKRDRSKTRGGRKFLRKLKRIVEERVEQEGSNGGVPRDNEGVSARKRAGKEGKKG